MENNRKKIIIAGAGFAGIQAALTLAKKNLNNYDIILIDQHDVHVYTADLYEIASAFNEKITDQCLTRLKDTVATPLNRIVPRGVIFIRDTVSKIFPSEKKIVLKNIGEMGFEYLVLSLGSVTNYYGIPGLKEASYPLKTLSNALAINCHLDLYFQMLWRKNTVKEVTVVVGGGGATGIEYVCELPGYIKKLSNKYSYPLNKIKIILIEGSDQLCSSGKEGTLLIKKRCEGLGIKIILGTFIKKADGKTIIILHKNKETMIPSDILIWTGGIMPHPLIRESFKIVAKNGSLPVNEFLQSREFPHIFAAGDNAFFQTSADEKPAPMLAQIAIAQGKILSENIRADIKKIKKMPYSVHMKGMIVPLGGKHAIFKKNSIIISGFFVWILRRLVDLRYALSILPFFYALRKWVHNTNVFIEND